MEKKSQQAHNNKKENINTEILRKEVLRWIKEAENKEKKQKTGSQTIIRNNDVNKIKVKTASKAVTKSPRSVTLISSQKKAASKKNISSQAVAAKAPVIAKREGGRHKNLSKIFAVTGIIIVIFAIYSALGIYYFAWDNIAVETVASALNLPIAKINGHIINFNEYKEEVRSLNAFYETQAKNGKEAMLSRREIAGKAISKKIEAHLLEVLASKYGVKVSVNEVVSELQNIAGSDMSFDDLEKNLLTSYGWDVVQFQDKVIRPFLMQKKLEAAIAADKEANKNKHKKIKDILDKIQKKELSFSEAASRYSEDDSAANNGDMGYIKRGDTSKAMEDIIFSLKNGEVSGIIRTPFGFHILKLAEKSKIIEGNPEARVLNIFVRAKSLNEEMMGLMKKANIQVYIRI